MVQQEVSTITYKLLYITIYTSIYTIYTTTAGGFAADDLYLLDLVKGDNKAEWINIPVYKGQTPGRRYGHSLVYYKPYLILFGGNLNNEPVNDVWTFNSENQPLTWVKLDIKDSLPCARLYHSAGVCSYGSANGMMVIFGGRSKEGTYLNDMWGLRRHRSGVWDWMKAPFKGVPKERLQHCSVFLGPFFINIGGRNNKCGDDLPIDIYDTETSEWSSYGSFRRFRYASFLYDNYLYLHGGLEDDKQNNPAKDLKEVNVLELVKNNEHVYNKIKAYLNRKNNNSANSGNSSVKGSNISDNVKDSCLTDDNSVPPLGGKNIVMSNKVVIGGKMDNKADFVDLVRYCSVEKLKKDKNEKENIMKMFKNSALNLELHDKIIMALLRPKEWIGKEIEEDTQFNIEPDVVIALINSCLKIIESQPMVLKVEAPAKIFGDIHGQYQDLMRFFDLYSAPIEGPGGDIDGQDYVFLGDYVDRGTHSLETICLLMALKIKYPNQIHLLRGNHEDRWINSQFGFKDECVARLNDDDSNPILFNKFNDLFDYLPLSAIINDTVLCIHGGIGSSITSIADIETIPRPLEVIHEVNDIRQQIVVDVLWSDPTDSDIEMGIQPNSTRDPTGVGNIVKFGPDRVDEFLNTNNLSLILRAHECVMDGFERFAGGHLITVFSATDYCGRHKNAGAILFLTKNFQIKPHLIYPTECPNKNWDNGEEALKLRPPTPPRNRQGSTNSMKSFN